VSKKLFLSNSQIDTYQTCPKKWYNQKVLRLRPTWTNSAFLFGSAIDAAVEQMLLNVGKTVRIDPWEAFTDNFTYSEIQINNTIYKEEEALLRINFFSNDIQPELFDSEKEREEADAILGFAKAKRKAKEALTRAEQLAYNKTAFNSLLAKADYFLEALEEWIDENVKEVHAIQKKIEIKNDEGDVFVGYLDFVVTLMDGRKILVDLKTSSNPKAYYPEGCVEESRQLAIYAQEEGLDAAAYLVIDKVIRKRDPRVRLHFIEGEVTEEQLDQVFDEIADVTVRIKNKEFPKNKDSCFAYGSKCEYYNFCHFGKKKGLEKV
jgi:hypothetical protein